jgi:hypothetical protein
MPDIDNRLLDKQWRVNHLYKIVSKKGKLVTFKENEAQAKYNCNAHNRNINLKSRQRGFTTNACIDGLDDVLFNRNFNFTLIADTKDNAQKIFEKINLAWENFPLKHLYKVDTDNKQELKFGHGSSVRVTTSARSTTVQRLHISEFGKICAKYPDKAKEIITGSIPAVPLTGRVDIESTAEGETGYFYEMCQEAIQRGEPTNNLEFKFHFFGWTDDDDCKLQGDYLQIPHDLRQYQAKFNLTDEQIYWYFCQKKTLKDKMKQEYPSNPDEAFESSGTKLFPIEIILRKLQTEVEQGEKINEWTYYREYRPGHQYGLGVDVSEGIGRDANAIVIIDFTKQEIVATYKNANISPDLLAYEIRNGATKYGNCIAGVERNNHGYATLVKLREIYISDNIFKEEKVDKIRNTKVNRFGWLTNAATKPRILYDLKTAIEEDLLIVPDRALLTEMKIYDREELNKVKTDEETTNHFDLLMACAIAWEMRKYVITVKSNDKQSQQFEINEQQYNPNEF